MEKRVIVRWRQGLEFEAESRSGARVLLAGDTSEPAFRPAALMLAALAGCTGMDAMSILVKKRQRIDRYEVAVTGQQREEHPRTFSAIVVEHVVEGRTLDDAAVARAIELSARKYCVVGTTIASGDTTIEHRFRIRDEAGERTCECLVIGPFGAGLASSEPATEAVGATA